MTCDPTWVELARSTVFFDFDGTISTADVGVVLLERLGDPAWRELEGLYARGEIGSRECIAAQFELLPADEERLRAVAAEVPLDPSLASLVASLHDAGAEVAVVSDGFGFYVEDRLRAAGVDVPVITNAADFAAHRLEFPNLDRCCACQSCGTCKQAPIHDAHRRGRTAVFVGDGVSDRKAALLADVLFAKEQLASWCDAFDVDYRPFRTLADVATGLGLTPPPA